MNVLTEKEFIERVEAIQRARRIFIETGLTKNISDAFEVYQEVLAETVRVRKVNKKQLGPLGRGLFEDSRRPICPACGAVCYFRRVPKNKKGILTQLVCSRANCQTVVNSNLDLQGWQSALAEMTAMEIQNIVEGLERGSKQDPLPGAFRGESETVCPECGAGKMLSVKGCCGAPHGYLWCPFCKHEIIRD